MRLPIPHRLRDRHRSRGQSVVELALILPVLLLIFLAAVDFGRVYLGWVNLQSMTRVAANYAANHAEAWYAPDDATKSTARARYSALVLQDAQRINCDLPDANGDGQADVPDPVIESTVLGSGVTVNITCIFTPLTPIISSIVGANIQVSSHATFPVKSGGSGAGLDGTPVAAPSASFIASPSSGYGPLDVDLIDTSTGSPTSWLWTFGDGFTSSQRTPPTHTYELIGEAPTSYVARLRVCNAGGCSDAAPVTIELEPAPAEGPVPAFTATPRFGTNPLTVSFTDASSPTPTSWIWDFGDGTPTSDQQDPPHTYANPGVYTVSLTVSDGVTPNTIVRTDYVVVQLEVCTVPGFSGVRRNDAQDLWEEEGFTTQVAFQPGNGNYNIQYQSLTALFANPPGGCAAAITVGP